MSSLLGLLYQKHDIGDVRGAFGVAQSIFRNQELSKDEKKVALKYMIDNYSNFIQSLQDDYTRFFFIYSDLVEAYRLKIPTPGGFGDPKNDDREWPLLHMVWIDTLKSQATFYKKDLLYALKDSLINLIERDFSFDEFKKFMRWAGLESES